MSTKKRVYTRKTDDELGGLSVKTAGWGKSGKNYWIAFGQCRIGSDGIVGNAASS